MPSNTQIKIRYGMIMQAVLSRALKDAGYSFAETPAYDPDCEVPDFLIPNAEKPKFMLEVHQTEARNHFQMKTLRSVTAVAEAKAFFGPDLISVNVLFGDPDRELPAANLRAMCGIFDTNLILRREASENGKEMIADLERVALEHATNVKLATAEACRKLCASHPKAVTEFKRLLQKTLDGVCVKAILKPIWVAERKRRRSLGVAPEPGEATFYKKNMVRSLFFQDEHFEVMVDDPRPNNWCSAITQQLVTTGIGSVTEEIDGDHLVIDEEFLSFLKDPDAPKLRQLCKDVLDSTPSMRVLFEDIRDAERRLQMATKFLEVVNAGLDETGKAVDESFRAGSFHGISHERCWIADLMPLCVARSHNAFNRAMVAHPSYALGLANPFNNVTIRSPRLQANGSKWFVYRDTLLAVFKKHLDEAESPYGRRMKPSDLARSLLYLRLLGVMRLQKLDPLELIAQVTATHLGLRLEHISLSSVLSELAEEAAVGRFDFLDVRSPTSGKSVLLKVMAPEGNPRDKAKEWGARRLAILYTIRNGDVELASQSDAVFVLDGVWDQSDVTRLHRSGWTHVVRMGQLKAALSKIFIVEAKKTLLAVAAPLRMEELDDLPMAAEED